jgi:type IV pilus assembly protein PilB
MAVKKRLGEMLVEAGVIDETQLHAALGHQRQWGGRLGQCLVEMKLASEESIVDALAVKFGFEVARLDRLEPYAFEQARALVPVAYATRNSIFPIAADTAVLTVAMSDPTNLSLTDELAFRSGRRVKVCIAGENAIAAAVRHHYGEEVESGPEAIDLGADDGATMEPIYDPIGATSSEEMNRFYQQDPVPPHPRSAPAPAPAPARPAPAAPSARPAAPTRAATPAAAPARAAPRAAPPAAPPAPAAPIAPAAPTRGPAAPAPAAPRPAPRTAAELQLEDQPTGSLPLEAEATASILLDATPADDGPEELQPIPLDGEPLGPEDAGFPAAEGTYAPAEAGYAEGEAGYDPAYGQGDTTYAQGDAGYAQGDATYAQGDAGYPGDASYPPAEAGYADPAYQPDAAYAQGDAAYAPQPPAEEEWVEGPVRPRELTAEESMILDEIGRMAGGDDSAATIVRPAQLLATLIRLLIRKQLITEQELLDEILRG